jgi:hypothetical protein
MKIKYNRTITPASSWWGVRCQICGNQALARPYGAFACCMTCRTVLHAWCWSKFQGLEAEDIQLRHESAGGPGMAYLCTLCGYWHWTSHTSEPQESLKALISLATDLMAEIGFHINVARGWGKLRHPADCGTPPELMGQRHAQG